MSEYKMYSIGDFSEKTGISIRTLHYYDEKGLLTPEKDSATGHRKYSDQDVLTLQKIICLKFLGYRLDEIRDMLEDSAYDSSLIESLRNQRQALDDKKKQIETAMNSISRVIRLIEEKGEVDSLVLMSLIHSMQTEKEQRAWLEQHISKSIVDNLYKTAVEPLAELDLAFVDFAHQVKQLVGTPVDHPKVQQLIHEHMTANLQYAEQHLNEEVMNALQNMEQLDITSLEKTMASPFTKEEEAWLNQAMAYYMKQEQP